MGRQCIVGCKGSVDRHCIVCCRACLLTRNPSDARPFNPTKHLRALARLTETASVVRGLGTVYPTMNVVAVAKPLQPAPVSARGP